MINGHNVIIPQTRRYPNLPKKVLLRDSKIATRLISAWDERHDVTEVLTIFLKEKNNLSDERYWELMRTVWIISGSVLTAPIFRELMFSKRKEKYYFSTPEEAAFLRSFPAEFAIFRATNDENDGGLSWTISKYYAEYYKTVYKKDIVISKIVTKKDCFAYIERNNESEIILL